MRVVAVSDEVVLLAIIALGKVFYANLKMCFHNLQWHLEQAELLCACHTMHTVTFHSHFTFHLPFRSCPSGFH